jgi:inner membrane protein
MQKSLLIKAALVAAIFFLLQVPLKMIDGIVAERWGRQQAVLQELASQSYGRQTMAGPILSIPYVEEFEETVLEDRAKKIETRRIYRTARFFPLNSKVTGSATVETKSRGLFKARVFNWQGAARGELVFDGKLGIERRQLDSRISWGKPSLALLLSDPRGLIGSPRLAWNGKETAMERGSGFSTFSSGLHATLPEFDPAEPQRVEYTLDLGLHGIESIALVPVAANDHVTLHSNWPHPSFGGQFLPLPELQRVSKEGFEAQWMVSALASNAQQQLLALPDAKPACGDGLCVDRIEVRFIEPIDIYSLSDRALKYGFLFVGLTFACFFLFEVLKTLPVHPAQYFLVGLALVAFFLLLIGLSEHVRFWLAYAIASAACIALLGAYLATVLRKVRRGLGFAAVLTALYGALYGLLVSEDDALLLGSLLVFALIAAVMFMTRNVDWYALRSRA